MKRISIFLLSLWTMTLMTSTHANEVPDPLMAEELVDMVLRHCRDGEALQAQKLAQDIREQFATTPAIDTLLAPAVEGRCDASAVRASVRELHFSVGWDDNVNLGLLANSVTFQMVQQPVSYQLDDSYKPVHSAFVSASGLYQTTVASDWTLQAIAGVRQLQDYSPLNTLGFQVNALHSTSLLGVAGITTIGWAQTWLGGHHYRSAPSVAWNSLAGAGRHGWSWAVSAQQHDYSGSPLDARLMQVSTSYRYRPQAQTQITMVAGLMHDQALGQRAGGNRQGTSMQVSWQEAWQGGAWNAQWALHQWVSTEAFLPGLMDYHRSNRTGTVSLGYQRPVRSGGIAYAEFQLRDSRDNVPLYVYRSNQLMLGWMLRWP